MNCNCESGGGVSIHTHADMYMQTRHNNDNNTEKSCYKTKRRKKSACYTAVPLTVHLFLPMLSCCFHGIMYNVWLISALFLQPVVRIYDIPDHTFESDDEDESSSDDDDESESEGMYSWITISAVYFSISMLLVFEFHFVDFLCSSPFSICCTTCRTVE